MAAWPGSADGSSTVRRSRDRIVRGPPGARGAPAAQHLRHARPRRFRARALPRTGRRPAHEAGARPRHRELAILLVAARTAAEYEWVQHVGISRALGIDEAQISAVEHGNLDADCFDPATRVLLRFTAEVLERPRPDDETFSALAERFPARQIVELLLVVGNYHMLARIMTALDIELDEAVGSTVIDEAQRHLRREP